MEYQYAISGVNLLLSDYFDALDSVILRNRLQACRTFPMFVPIFCNAIIVMADGAFDTEFTNAVTEADLLKLRQAVDIGKPLVKAIATCFKVKPSTIRYLVGKVQSQYCQKEFLHKVVSFVKIIDSLAPDLRPKNKEDWEWFESFLDTSDSVLTANYQINWVKQISAYQKSQDKLIKNCKKNHPVPLILDFIDSLNFTVNRHAWRLLKNSNTAKLDKFPSNKNVKTNSDCQDSFKDRLATHVHKVIEAELMKINIFELVQLANAWKVQLDKLQLAIQPSRKLTLIKWRSLIDSPVSLNGCTVVPLSSALDLHTEGDILQHCAANYVSKCLMDGDTHIFSIRDSNSNPLSTIEVNADIPSKRIRLIQHVAFENSQPSSQCNETAKFFMTYLNNTVTANTKKLITNEWLERLPANSLSIYRDLHLSSSIDVLFLRYRQYFGKHVFVRSIGRLNFIRLLRLAIKLT